jgi:predicted metal-dependent phosphoesterase TrpH
MKLRTNLHLHTSDDQEDFIEYSFIDALNTAKIYGFECLALTCHNTFVDREDYRKAAEALGILLIPGVEKTIEKRHVVVLNPDRDIDAVKTFAELSAYKKTHPQIFVLAAHPYFPGGYSLQEKLEEHLTLFDAIEHSWFYSKRVNFNERAERLAETSHIPFIATSDTHDLKFLDTNYAEIEVKEKTIPAIFEAIRNNNFTNTTFPRKLFREMTAHVLTRHIANHLERRKKRG